jgi:hypothetical protein
MLGHPAKNDCSTEALLDFCTSVTFLRSVPVHTYAYTVCFYLFVPLNGILRCEVNKDAHG